MSIGKTRRPYIGTVLCFIERVLGVTEWTPNGSSCLAQHPDGIDPGGSIGGDEARHKRHDHQERSHRQEGRGVGLVRQGFA